MNLWEQRLIPLSHTNSCYSAVVGSSLVVTVYGLIPHLIRVFNSKQCNFIELPFSFGNCNINATTCENHVKLCLRLGRLKITTNINCLLPALRTCFLKKRWHNNVYRSVYQVAVLNSVLASQRHHCCSMIKQTLHCGVETDKESKSGFFCLSTRRKFIKSCNH